jgi:hypothetical protein
MRSSDQWPVVSGQLNRFSIVVSASFLVFDPTFAWVLQQKRIAVLLA